MRYRYFLFAIVKSHKFHAISLPESVLLVNEAAIQQPDDSASIIRCC